MTIKKKRKTRQAGVMAWVLFAGLAVYAAILLCITLWGIGSSLKTIENFNEDKAGFPSGAPWRWAWNNFTYVFENFFITVTNTSGVKKVWLENMLVNTPLYAGGGAFLQAFVPCFVAYLTAKFPYKFSKVVYMIVIVAITLPIVGADPSAIKLMQDLGLYDTIAGNWIQKFNFLGMYFLVFYATFKGIPNDYAEAAYVDGASETCVYFKVIFPLVVNTFLTVFLIKFIELWNDYQSPLLYLPSHPTLALGVYTLTSTTLQGFNNVPVRMATCVIMVIPVLILFVAFKDKLLKNVSMGGIKE